MATNEEIQGDISPQQPLQRRSSRVDTKFKPKSDPILAVCRCFSVITAISALLCLSVNVLSAIRSFKNGSDVFDGIFRCYAVVIAAFVAVAETEWKMIFKFSKIFEYWPGRGMLQIFVAVMTRAFPDDIASRQDLVLLQNIACFLLLSCGVVYIVSGFLCIGCLKRSREQKETNRDQTIKDLEELEKRQHELEALLMENRERNH